MQAYVSLATIYTQQDLTRERRSRITRIGFATKSHLTDARPLGLGARR